LAAGVHPKVVSDRLGHSTLSITIDTYSHVMPSLDADAAATVASQLFTLHRATGARRAAVRGQAAKESPTSTSERRTPWSRSAFRTPDRLAAHPDGA